MNKKIIVRIWVILEIILLLGMLVKNPYRDITRIILAIVTGIGFIYVLYKRYSSK